MNELPKDVELLLMFYLETGLRIGEFIALDINDLKAENHEDKNGIFNKYY